MSSIVGNSIAPVTAARGAPMRGAAQAYRVIGISAETSDKPFGGVLVAIAAAAALGLGSGRTAGCAGWEFVLRPDASDAELEVRDVIRELIAP
jgi:hypothetical protein